MMFASVGSVTTLVVRPLTGPAAPLVWPLLSGAGPALYQETGVAFAVPPTMADRTATLAPPAPAGLPSTTVATDAVPPPEVTFADRAVGLMLTPPRSPPKVTR